MKNAIPWVIAVFLNLGAIWAILQIPERESDPDGIHLRFNVPRCHRLDDRSIGCKVERLKPMKDWWRDEVFSGSTGRGDR